MTDSAGASFSDTSRALDTFGPSILLPCTTFVVLCCEIALTRVFAYIYPYQLTVLAVSLAVFGLGTGAYIRVQWLSSLPQTAVAVLAHLALGGSLLAMYLLLGLTHEPTVIIALGALPFVFAGIAISRYYEVRRASRVATTYALDLGGAATGCLAAVLLLTALGADGTLLALAAFAGASAVLAARRATMVVGVILGIVCVALCVGTYLSRSYLPDSLLNRHSGLDKQLPFVLRQQGGEVLDSAWSTVGRADLYQRSSQPGLKVILTDAMTSTAFLANTTGGLQDSFAYVPYAVAPVRAALILGSGGGLEVRVAREAGVREIDAVELNAAVIRLVRRWERFGGPIYDQPGVTLFVKEARAFVQTRTRRYDLIQMSLVLTASAQSGTYALAEGYLYTQEAFRSYLDHLEPTGTLAMIDDDFERTLKNVVTAASVFERAHGLPSREAMQHMAVVFNPRENEPGYRYLLLVSPTALSESWVGRLMTEVSRRSLQIVWVPGVAGIPAYQALAQHGTRTFVSAAPLNLAPATDDKPYFYNFAKTSEQILQLVRPYLILSGVMVAALIVMFIAHGTTRTAAGRRAAALAALYGVGFMVIELGLLQKLTLAVGGPTQVLAVLLFALLLYCGAGSLLSARLASSFRARAGSFAIVVAIVGALTAVVVERYYLLPGVSSATLRVACVLAIVGPIGLSLGAPFPDLLRRFGESDERRVAYLWAVNGVAAVLGAGLTLILSLIAGGQVVLLTGSALYLLAWVIDR